MAQLAIYLDKETARLLAEAARRDGVSRSALARRAIRSHLHRRLPDSFFEALGGWEEGRSAEEILLSIRTGPEQKDRELLE